MVGAGEGVESGGAIRTSRSPLSAAGRSAWGKQRLWNLRSRKVIRQMREAVEAGRPGLERVDPGVQLGHVGVQQLGAATRWQRTVSGAVFAFVAEGPAADRDEEAVGPMLANGLVPFEPRRFQKAAVSLGVSSCPPITKRCGLIAGQHR